MSSAQNYFSKKFKFKNENCQLPYKDEFYSSTVVQQQESLQIIKSILNHVKSKLNDFQIEDWSRHTRNRNPAQQILHHLKTEIKAEFVTQAFAKFFECLSAYPMVRDPQEQFTSIHLCEAPGAFVCAMNHYLKLHHPDVNFNWCASTLNPYFEGNSISNTILDDRLISHTLENWIFGDDYDGDILKESNMRSLISCCKTLSEVHLVSGDGSIDCLDQPENQEEFVSRLHQAEFIVSLAILADGGSMLIKMFTFFETSSVAILYVLSCCFQELHIFKPATSKEGNSEVYVIGLGFKKHVMKDEIVEQMIVGFQDKSKTLLPLSAIPKDFLGEVIEAAKLFMNFQVATIEGNIRTFKKYDRLENERIRQMKVQLVDQFVKLYQIKPIRADQTLLHGLQMSNDINLNVRVHSGSHSERMTFFHLNRHDQFQVFSDRLKHFYDSIFENALKLTCDPQRLGNNKLDVEEFIKLIHGRPIERVASSKFILVSLAKYMIELQKFIELDENEGYGDKRYSTQGNLFTIEIEYYRTSPSYNTFEKHITTEILQFLLDGNTAETLIVEGLPLFTQFLVGIILYLSLFVFQEVHLKRSSGSITFKSFLPNGKQNLKLLIDKISQHPTTDRAILGICNTKSLFSLSSEFYRSVVEYNNHLCLKFCSFYLNISNNL